MFAVSRWTCLTLSLSHRAPPWPAFLSPVNSRRGAERRHRAQASPWSLDLGRPSEIGWFGLNPSRSNPSPSIGIWPPLSLPPHPRLCLWPASQFALTRWRISPACQPRPRDLIWAVDLWSDGWGYPVPLRVWVLLKNPLDLGNQPAVLCFSA
jgi:hypothetical protein